MGCHKFRSYISKRYDGEFSWKQEGDLDEHVKSCPSCREELYQMDKLRDIISNIDTCEPSPDFNARLWARIRQERYEPSPEMTFTFKQKAKWVLATSLVTVIVLSIAVLTDPRLKLLVKQEPRTAEQKTTPHRYQSLLGANKVHFVMDNYKPFLQAGEADNPRKDEAHQYILERKTYPQSSLGVQYVLPVVSTRSLVEEESF